MTFHFYGVGLKIHAQQFHAAGSGSEKSGKHFDGSGFTGAIGSEEAKELAGLHAQVYRIDGGQRAEAASELLSGDGELGHGAAHSSTGSLTSIMRQYAG